MDPQGKAQIPDWLQGSIALALVLAFAVLVLWLVSVHAGTLLGCGKVNLFWRQPVATWRLLVPKGDGFNVYCVL